MVKNKLEHDIQNEIRIWCGEHDLLAIRINVGSGYTKDGRFFTTGAPNGYPDLTILGKNGKMCYCETKTPVGRLRPDQKQFHANLKERGFKVIVPHSLEEFIKEAEEWLNEK